MAKGQARERGTIQGVKVRIGRKEPLRSELQSAAMSEKLSVYIRTHLPGAASRSRMAAENAQVRNRANGRKRRLDRVFAEIDAEWQARQERKG